MLCLTSYIGFFFLPGYFVWDELLRFNQVVAMQHILEDCALSLSFLEHACVDRRLLGLLIVMLEPLKHILQSSEMIVKYWEVLLKIN